MLISQKCTGAIITFLFLTAAKVGQRFNSLSFTLYFRFTHINNCIFSAKVEHLPQQFILLPKSFFVNKNYIHIQIG